LTTPGGLLDAEGEDKPVPVKEKETREFLVISFSVA
jgi:hypothetical protein